MRFNQARDLATFSDVSLLLARLKKAIKTKSICFGEKDDVLISQ